MFDRVVVIQIFTKKLTALFQGKAMADGSLNIFVVSLIEMVQHGESIRCSLKTSDDVHRMLTRLGLYIFIPDLICVIICQHVRCSSNNQALWCYRSNETVEVVACSTGCVLFGYRPTSPYWCWSCWRQCSTVIFITSVVQSKKSHTLSGVRQPQR